MEKQIFTGPSKKRKRVARKDSLALRAEDINRVLLKAIEEMQDAELGSLMGLVARNQGVLG